MPAFTWVLLIAMSVAILVSTILPALGAQLSPAESEDDPMQIHFERSGGFAGLRLTTALDEQSLTPQEARKLKELIEAVDFLRFPSISSRRVPVPIGFSIR